MHLVNLLGLLMAIFYRVCYSTIAVYPHLDAMNLLFIINNYGRGSNYDIELWS